MTQNHKNPYSTHLPTLTKEVKIIRTGDTSFVKVEILAFEEQAPVASIRRFVAGKGPDEKGKFYPTPAGIILQTRNLPKLIQALEETLRLLTEMAEAETPLIPPVPSWSLPEPPDAVAGRKTCPYASGGTPEPSTGPITPTALPAWSGSDEDRAEHLKGLLARKPLPL